MSHVYVRELLLVYIYVYICLWKHAHIGKYTHAHYYIDVYLRCVYVCVCIRMA